MKNCFINVYTDPYCTYPINERDNKQVAKIKDYFMLEQKECTARMNRDTKETLYYRFQCTPEWYQEFEYYDSSCQEPT